MLSFMKQGSERLAKLAEGGENAVQKSDDGFIKPAEHAKNLKQSTIILILLFAVGGGCLWFMIKKTAPQQASAAVTNQDMEIEKALAQIKGIRSEIGDKVDDVVGKFYNFSNVEQVGVEDLKKNPFVKDFAAPEITEDIARQQNMADETLIREQITRKAGTLQLQGIVESDKGNCCMINEKILYTGDTVEGFTVTKITPKSAELACSGVNVILKLTE